MDIEESHKLYKTIVNYIEYLILLDREKYENLHDDVVISRFTMKWSKAQYRLFSFHSIRILSNLAEIDGILFDGFEKKRKRKVYYKLKFAMHL